MIIPIFTANPCENLNFTKKNQLQPSRYNHQPNIYRVRSLIPNLNILSLLAKIDYLVNCSVHLVATNEANYIPSKPNLCPN
ncbi:MAG: hypothetical protein KME64_24050 [Scytonematopsis contorta HA4267-MV1]|nr:hypothetical protein [Scytonematopsis contorta HA4267-MV1]